MNTEFKVNDEVVITDDSKLYYAYSGKITKINKYENTADVYIWALDKEVTVNLSGISYLYKDDSNINNLVTINRAKLTKFIDKDLIFNDLLRKIVERYFADCVPDYFYIVPASSSGKYHPRFANEKCGLMLHTMQSIRIAKNLINSGVADSIFETEELNGTPFKPISSFSDFAYVALLIHDTFKSGYDYANNTVYSHPSIAADEFYNFAVTYYDKAIKDKDAVFICDIDDIHDSHEVNEARRLFVNQIETICLAVSTHMGKWGRIQPKNNLCKFVSLCDYLSAQKLFEDMYDISNTKFEF